MKFSNEFEYRTEMALEAHNKGLFEYVPRNFSGLSLEEKDSILMGLLETKTKKNQKGGKKKQ